MEAQCLDHFRNFEEDAFHCLAMADIDTCTGEPTWCFIEFGVDNGEYTWSCEAFSQYYQQIDLGDVETQFDWQPTPFAMTTDIECQDIVMEADCYQEMKLHVEGVQECTVGVSFDSCSGWQNDWCYVSYDVRGQPASETCDAVANQLDINLNDVELEWDSFYILVSNDDDWDFESPPQDERPSTDDNDDTVTIDNWDCNTNTMMADCMAFADLVEDDLQQCSIEAEINDCSGDIEYCYATYNIGGMTMSDLCEDLAMAYPDVDFETQLSALNWQPFTWGSTEVETEDNREVDLDWWANDSWAP